MDLAELLVNDAAGAGGGRTNVFAGVLDQFVHLLCLRIVAEQRHGAVAVGEEVDLVADPHGIEVVGIGAGIFSVVRSAKLTSQM